MRTLAGWLFAFGLILAAAAQGANADVATSACAWDPSFVDTGRAPLGPERVAALTLAGRPPSLSWRELVARLGPAARHESEKADWHVLRWPVSDGTEFAAAAADFCTPTPRTGVYGVAAGSDEADSPEAKARALYRWIIEDGLDNEHPWSATISGLVGKSLFRALETERVAYLACDAWQESQLPMALKWEVFVDSFSRDDGQPNYNDEILEPRARFIAHLYPVGATGFTRTTVEPEAATVTIAVRVNDGGFYWTERVLLAREGARWVIVDVLHGDRSSDTLSTTQEFVERSRWTASTCLCPTLESCPEVN